MSRDFVHLASEAFYLCPVQSWSKIAPKVRALSDRKFERRKDLVALLHESESNVSNWLSGSRTPQLDTAFRLVEAVGGRWSELTGEVASAPIPDVVPAPLVAEDVGAGEPTLRVVRGEERHYYFRPDWLAGKGLTVAQVAVYRLGPDTVAMSMHPTIQPESILLVDREADRDVIPARSIWIVSSKDVGDRLVLKRVTRIGDHLVLESDNRDAEFAPRIVKANGKARRHILEGKVIWYATEVE